MTTPASPRGEDSVLTPRVEGHVSALLALAERCEREWESIYLDLDIWNAVSKSAPWRFVAKSRATITCDRYGKDAIGNPVVSLDAFSSSLDAAVTLEPADAQEVCVRKYPNGKTAVRITLADGSPCYSEGATEALARCGAALRALAALARDGKSQRPEGSAEAAGRSEHTPTEGDRT